MILLAFHVDYWDYLGWPDRFGHAAFTKRQRVIASLNRSRTVYTPQLVLQGQDFRQRGSFKQHVKRINRSKARADITLRIRQDAKTLGVLAEATVAEDRAQQPTAMYVALYENNLRSDVTAGENAGRTLHHDFVVRKWIGPLKSNRHGTVRWEQDVSLEKEWKPHDMGVVVCVLGLRNGDVLQAVALPLAHRKAAR